jgi:hypothetical protein
MFLTIAYRLLYDVKVMSDGPTTRSEKGRTRGTGGESTPRRSRPGFGLMLPWVRRIAIFRKPIFAMRGIWPAQGAAGRNKGSGRCANGSGCNSLY